MSRTSLLVHALSACMAAVLTACWSNGPSHANLAQQLDSVRALEQYEQMRMQGLVRQQSDNPLQEFCDSLDMLSLPISYSDDLLDQVDLFRYVPEPIALALSFETRREESRAVRLPRLGKVLPILIAGLDEGELTEMWLFTLDRDYMTLDKICLYDAGDDEEEHYFAITSDFDIYRNHVVYNIDRLGYIQELIIPDEE